MTTAITAWWGWRALRQVRPGCLVALRLLPTAAEDGVYIEHMVSAGQLVATADMLRELQLIQGGFWTADRRERFFRLEATDLFDPTTFAECLSDSLEDLTVSVVGVMTVARRENATESGEASDLIGRAVAVGSVPRRIIRDAL
jgi:hypothetical protein